MKKFVLSVLFALLIGVAGFMQYNANMSVLKETESGIYTVPAELGSGTGYFVNENTIVTDYHVVNKDGVVINIIDHKSNTITTAKIIYVDKLNDIAILRIKTPIEGITPLCVYKGSLIVGDNIISGGYGNPYEQKFHKDFHFGRLAGFIAGSFDGIHERNYTLADIMAYPGDSGSPVLLENSCVIGNIHFGIDINGKFFSGLTGISGQSMLIDALNKAHVDYSTFVGFQRLISDTVRLDKATVRIAITPIA